MEFVEGLPSRILVKGAEVIVAYGRHLDEGRVPFYLLRQGRLGTKELLGRVKAIAGGVERAREVALEACSIVIKSLVTESMPRYGGCHGQTRSES
jgi:hypothetical protein